MIYNSAEVGINRKLNDPIHAVLQMHHSLRPRGREFDSRRLRFQVTTLGRLFTPMCLHGALRYH